MKAEKSRARLWKFNPLIQLVVVLRFFLLIPNGLLEASESLTSLETFQNRLNHFSFYGKTVLDPLTRERVPRMWDLAFEFASTESSTGLVERLAPFRDTSIGSGDVLLFHSIFFNWTLAQNLTTVPLIVEALQPRRCSPQDVWQTENGSTFWARPGFPLLGPMTFSNWKTECSDFLESEEQKEKSQRWIVWQVLPREEATSPLPGAIEIPNPHSGAICLHMECSELFSPSFSEGGTLTVRPVMVFSQNKDSELIVVDTLTHFDFSSVIAQFRREVVQIIREWSRRHPTQTQIDVVDSRIHLRPHSLKNPSLTNRLLIANKWVPITFQESPKASADPSRFQGIRIQIGPQYPTETAAETVLGALRFLSHNSIVFSGLHPHVGIAELAVRLYLPETFWDISKTWIPHLPHLLKTIVHPYLRNRYPLPSRRKQFDNCSALAWDLTEAFAEKTEMHWSDFYRWTSSSKVANDTWNCGINFAALMNNRVLEVNWFSADLERLTRNLSQAKPYDRLSEQVEIGFAIIGLLNSRVGLAPD